MCKTRGTWFIDGARAMQASQSLSLVDDDDDCKMKRVVHVLVHMSFSVFSLLSGLTVYRCSSVRLCFDIWNVEY